MALTPEGRIKKLVQKVLHKYPPDEIYYHMPVPYGYGASTLDFLVCFRGRFIAIETKRPGETPTGRQRQIITQMECAGAYTFVIDGEASLTPLVALLDAISVLPVWLPEGLIKGEQPPTSH